MPLWKADDTPNDRPQFLTTQTSGVKPELQRSNVVGVDAVEAGTSAKVNHQGWTVPAGGNDNPNAQRETLVCVNMKSDTTETSVGPGTTTTVGAGTDDDVDL